MEYPLTLMLLRSTSMSIYTSEKPKPYVYICTHIETGEYYIGYREKNTLPSHIDLPIYKTSSKIVKADFDSYTWAIVAEFTTGDDAYYHEQCLIYDAWGDSLMINKHHRRFSSPQFRCKGHSQETKDKIARTQKSRMSVPENREKISKTRKGQSNGPMALATKLKISAKRAGQKLGPTSAEKKIKLSNATKGIPKERVQCPHCGKNGGINNMKRYHFDNCKVTDKYNIGEQNES